MMGVLLVKTDPIVRTVTGRENYPQLYLTKELREAKFKKGDKVAILVEDGKITILRAEIKIKVHSEVE